MLARLLACLLAAAHAVPRRAAPRLRLPPRATTATATRRAVVLNPGGAAKKGFPSQRECVDELSKASKLCRAQGVRTFSITSLRPFMRALKVPKLSTDMDLAARHPINLQMPGLSVLDAERGVFVIDDFLGPGASAALLAGHGREGLTLGGSIGAWSGDRSDRESFLAEPAAGQCGERAEELGRRGFGMCHSRYSYSSCVRDPQSAAATEELSRRVDALFEGRFPPVNREPVVLVRYPEGGYYDHHLDMRRATVLTYLSDVTEGGATYFPHLDLRVQPRRGRALVFFPQNEHGKNVEELRHLAEENLSGDKWGATVWAHEKPFPEHGEVCSK